MSPKYVGSFEVVPEADPPGWVDGAPTSAVGQSCAMCGNTAVAWVHPLDASKVRYRAQGDEYTLPTFWALCDSCEDLYGAGDDESLIARMISSDQFIDDEEARKPLVTFRAADRGGRRFGDRA